MSLNLWIQQLARISLPWWSTPYTIHTFTLCKPQIMWYVSKSQNTSIHVYQNNVESEINVLHIKSPFQCRLLNITNCYQDLDWINKALYNNLLIRSLIKQLFFFFFFFFLRKLNIIDCKRGKPPPTLDHSTVAGKHRARGVKRTITN
jgi:hypothetical protein